MARKLLLIVASLTLVIAGAALYVSLSSSPTQATAATRNVLIATGDLPPGLESRALTSNEVRVVAVSPDAVPPGALSAISEVANLKTTVPVFKGQVLMARQFAATSATGGLPIPAGTNAISVELSDPARVAGFVQPGSRVVVYQTVNGISQVLLPSASVIAVGATTANDAADPATASNKAVATTIVTFALNAKQSTKLVSAPQGSLYLGLLPK